MKRFLSAILTLCMMTSMVPSATMSANAAESTEIVTTESTTEVQQETTVATQALTETIPTEEIVEQLTTISAEETQESTVPTEEAQEDIEASVWEYEICADGIILTAYRGTATDVYVPSTVDDHTVIKLGDGLFQDNDALNSVTLGAGILEIGAQVFYDCDNLVCVLISEELTTIGTEAFCSCDVFNSIILYDTVTNIGENAFADCSSVTIWCNEGTVGHSYAQLAGLQWEELNPDAIPEMVVLDGVTYYLNNGFATIMSMDPADRIVIPAQINQLPVTTINRDAMSQLTYRTAEVFLPDCITNIPDDFSFGRYCIVHCGPETYLHDYLKDKELPYILTFNQEQPEIISENNFTFYLYNTNVAVLKSYNGTDTKVTVPKAVSGMPVKKILPKAFQSVAAQEIVLPDSVDWIYSQAFYTCKNLLAVNIPASLETIADYTFYGCYFLENVFMHENIKSIGTDAFGNENHIYELNIPSGVTYIAKEAFRGSHLQEFTYPVNATVCDDAFSGSQLSRVNIPNEVTTFNHNAFPSSVIYYVYPDSGALAYCIDEGLMYCRIGIDPEPYLTSLYETSTISYYVFSEYAVVMGPEYYNMISEAVIPEYVDGVPVTMIHEGAFSNQSELVSVELPDTITYIGAGAFEYCNQLQTINLPKALKSISPSMFYYCSQLKEVELPDSIESIGASAFYNCGIEQIQFPDSLHTVGASAFQYSGLKELVYTNITYGEMAFENCDSLKELTIVEGVTSLPYRIFMDCNNLELVHTPYSLEDIDQYAFAFCPKVTFLVFNGSPTSTPIGQYAVKYGKSTCYSGWSQNLNPVEFEQDGILYYAVTNYSHRGNVATVIGSVSDISGHVELPEWVSYNGRSFYVYKIGDRAFDYTGITSINIPDSVTVIGDGAFQASALEQISLPDQLDYFGINMFNATKIEDFTFPTKYALNFGVFGYTNSIKNVTIPEGVKVIPEYSFNQCSNIKELVLPDSLEFIDRLALWGISVKYLEIPAKTVMANSAAGGMNIEKLVFKDGTTSISDNFDYCSKLESVYLPESISYIDYSAFEHCPKAVFCVYEDSYAQEYCQKRGLPYFVLNKTENPEISYGANISGMATYTDGTAASGATVEILYDDGAVKETVTTDETGAYAFTYAEVGQYTVRVTDTSGNSASTQVSVKRMNVFDVFLAGDTDLILKKGWTVSGTVSDGAATVTITDEIGNVLDSVETSDGGFAFENIPNGTYIVKAETENGTATQEVTVFDGAVSDIVLTVLSETVTIWGYVEVEDREYNHHRRNWVQVSIYNGEGTVIAQTKSDKDGMYRFDKLPTGQYSIVAETAEMRPDKKHSYDRSHTLTGYAYVDATTAGEYQVDTIILYEENDSLATISGKVTAQGESQACQVVLRNVFQQEVAQQTTGKNGKYSFTNIRDGLYFVIATTESDGMGYAIVVVRNGKVYGETDIKVYKADKIKDREDRFRQDFDGCHDRDSAMQHKDRIAEEKRFYDGLSEKEKKQLSREYVDRLEEMCRWIAQCEYVTDEGVSVEQGGLVISGDELENEDTVSFEIHVDKTDAWTANADGVKEDKDFIYHDMHDKAGNSQIKQYYEISMTRTVDGQTKQITSVTKDTDATGKFCITMEIPEEYRGHKHYTMLHVHNGVTYTLADLDDDPDTITFEVDGFSTFALAGTDEILVPIVNTEIWQDSQLYGNYTTLEEALNAYDSATQYVKLIRNTDVTLNLSQDLYLDLNGCTMTGTIVTNGYKIYGMDSTTNGYSCDSMGYFNCTDEQGNALVPEKLVKTDAEMTGNVLRYMTIETENGYTFHRFYLGITHTSLKPTVTGVGYKALFCGDDMVKAQLDADNAFGYSLQLEGLNSVSFCKGREAFVSGKTVTLRISNFDAKNFGETPLYGSVTMKLADGTVIESASYTLSLRQLLESVNENYTSYNAEQIAAVTAMIEKNAIMQTWNVDNLVVKEA